MKKLLALLMIAMLSVFGSTAFADEDEDNTDGTTVTSSDDSNEDEDENEDKMEDESMEDDRMDDRRPRPTNMQVRPDMRQDNRGKGNQNNVQGMERKEVNGEMRDKKQEFQEDMKELRQERNQELKDNKMQMQENRQEFRQENGEEMKDAFGELDEGTREALKDLGESHKEALDAIHEKYKEMERNEENYEAMREEIDALNATHYEEVKALLGDSADALNLLEKRKDVFKENQDLRKDSAEARKEFRGERNELVQKYKDSFISRLKNALDKIPDDKLEKVLAKIDAAMEKYEENEKITEERKDKIMSQLIALKEIIEEKIEERDTEEDGLDLEELLSVD